MVKKKWLRFVIPLAIVNAINYIIMFFIIVVVVDAVFSVNKSFVPKDKWHITAENGDIYEKKYLEYIEETAIVGWDCEVLRDKRYDYGMNSFKQWDFEIHYSDGFVLQINIACGNKGFFELNFFCDELTYDDAINIDDSYFDIIFKILKYCLYKLPIDDNIFKRVVDLKTENTGYIYSYLNEWYNDSYFPCSFSMYAKCLDDENYAVLISAQGYMTDENVWP